MAQQTLVPFGHFHPRLERRALRAAAPGAEDPRTRAAQYVRMSTDHQQYSIANQKEAIGKYAVDHGLTVVRTYVDSGRSGLTISRREGLCDLLTDVAERRTDFGVILVYDVSRWGRFQDADESACYEFLCRRAGIRVEYCREQFVNDATPMSSVLKGLKRVMAGEFSRELSDKVFAGKCRMVKLGFAQGAIPGYGLRRLIVDASGNRRGVLEPGQHKFAATDRTVLIPGPPEETATVRLIYAQIAHRRKRPKAIADDLNRRGVAGPYGKLWTAQRVMQVATNEKYIGNLIFNRTSTRLKTPKVLIPSDQWVRCDGAFEAVVPPPLFHKAQAVMASWTTRITDEAALEALRALFQKHGRLTARMIIRTPGMPSPVFYAYRFGTLVRAYSLVGYVPTRSYDFQEGYARRMAALRALRAQVLRTLVERGATAERESKTVLMVNGIRLAVVLGRCRKSDPRYRDVQTATPRPDWVLVGCLHPVTEEVVEYWLGKGCADSFSIGVKHRKQRARHASADLDPLLDILIASTARESSQPGGSHEGDSP